MTDSSPNVETADFIREQVASDLRNGTHGGRVQTRFPPEPNGYLHVGHAKSICLNFGIATEFGGSCNLRFDDTNPVTESEDFVDAIVEDLAWLGFDAGTAPRYASDYFEQLYTWAELLTEHELAYVDDQDAERISATRGGFTTPGTDSPYRNRSTAENLDLLRRMRAGEFADGSRVLRARIDMAHQNPQLRDPVLYRIRHAAHHRTGTNWSIYPTYDWAHGQSDVIEGVTHSICTLEFDVHRPLYDWFMERLGELGALASLGYAGERPRQYEFARLNVTHVVLSKRKLAQIVEGGHVEGWDDPRMPTLRGMRRLGYPAAALRAFCAHIGVAKVNGTHEVELLESFVRDELNRTALRRMAVLRPLRMVIENYPEEQVTWLDAVNNPEDPGAGSRTVPFSRVLYIEHDDFMQVPPPKFYRLSPGKEVRLRYGYFLTCTGVETDADGKVIELRATYDPATKGGQAPDGRKVKATIHWVSAAHAVDATVALYGRLFTEPHPDSFEGRDPLEFLNPGARELLHGVKMEPTLAELPDGSHVQFERLGYFSADRRAAGGPLFHRTVGLKDDWAKIRKRQN